MEFLKFFGIETEAIYILYVVICGNCFHSIKMLLVSNH